MSLPVLLLDFDGTVCIGDGPVLAYADAVLPLLPPEQSCLGARRLADYLRRGQPAAPAAPAAGPTDDTPASPADDAPEPADAYVLIADLASGQLDSDVLSRAYLESRQRLQDEDLDVSAPDGLRDLLGALEGVCRRVLLTNSPSLGIARTLERIGLDDVLDEVVTDGHKPERIAGHIARLLDGAPPERLMSVGDHWPNDIAVPLELGCATAFVTPMASPDRPAHLVGPSVAAMGEGIEQWARDPHSFGVSHTPGLGART